MLLLLQFPHNTNEILSTYLRTLALRTCTTQNFSHLHTHTKKSLSLFHSHIIHSQNIFLLPDIIVTNNLNMQKMQIKHPTVFFCTSWWLVYSLLLPIEYCTCSHIHLQIKWFSISNINTVIASTSADSCTLVMCSMRSAYRVDGITITTCAE